MTTTGSAHKASAIELAGVSKRFGETLALDDVSLRIGEQEFVVLLGPSGCGKSTILKVIAGLEDATEGEIYIDGQLANYIAPKARDVAMVFQNYALYPHMTVAKNVGFPLKMTGHPKAEVQTRVNEVAHLLELEPELGKHPEQLSGGQRQRVALGRAIIRNPAAFLMDEPLSNLDALLRVQMRDELLKLHHRVGRTTIYVTHDQLEAMTMADRIVVMKSGVVQQVGSPREVYAEPSNTFVATFVGSPQINLFPGRVQQDAEGGLRFLSPALNISLDPKTIQIGSGEQVTLGVRPEDISLVAAAEPDAVLGTVTLVEPVGPDIYLKVALAGESSCALRVAPTVDVAQGERVNLRFSPTKLHLFAEHGGRVRTRQPVPS